MASQPERRGGRPKARETVMRVLYEAEVTGDDPRELLALAFGRLRMTEEGRRYAEELLRACHRNLARIDARIQAALRNWELARLGKVECAILRMAAAELFFQPDVPVKVVLDEALRLARRYGDPKSAGFVNGVLDALAGKARAKEIKSIRPKPEP